MDTEALHVALQQSFSPDASLRLPAEQTIKNLKQIPGAIKMLLEIATEKQVQFEIRQAAAIQMKNLCRECWTERYAFMSAHNESGQQQIILSEDDKDFVRMNLVGSLLSEPEKSIQGLMAETLHSIAIHDFPDNWPTLLPTLLQSIALSNDSSQALRVHNSLLALRKVCKRYEFKPREHRGPLNEIVAQSFPLLLPLARRLCDPGENSVEAAMMLKQILKIFWSSTQFYLPGDSYGNSITPCLSNPHAMQPWFDVLHFSLAKPLPEEIQPHSVDERNSWPWWKVKKWAAQIMARLFSRYGIASYAEDEAKDFANFFSQNVAPQFLGPVCDTLNLRPTGQFCTDRVVHLCLTFVDLAIELAPTYKMLKPHMDFLLYQVCFPTVCLTSDDIDLFENDPHEFVHRQNSPLADFYDPRMSAITLITNVVKHRGKDVIPRLLAFLQENLNRYMIATNELKNPVEKDGTFLILGSLSEVLFRKKPYVTEVEGLLISSVFPEFGSPVGFLRSRACWMVQRFSSVKWTDDGTHLKTLLEMVLRALSDPALPVQIEASKALRFLIDADVAHQTLIPVLPKVLEEYFRIMNEIGNDEVVTALQVIIDKFGDHIEPHATALVSQLTAAFKTYCDAGDDDDDAAMAAAQCLECISTVLKGICERPEIYKTLEPHLLPVTHQILSKDGDFIEYLENALDIITFLTYFPSDISNELWEIFPMIYLAFDQWAFDYLNLMVPPLENFISKAPQVFMSKTTIMDNKTVSYADLIVSIVTKTLQEDRASPAEARKAVSLFMSLLLNCKGMLDNYLTMINDQIISKLAQQASEENPATRISLLVVIAAAFYYNPLLELAELEKRGVTQQVFAQWLSDAEKMDKWFPRKITVIALCSILQLPSMSLPQTVGNMIPQIVSTITSTTSKIEKDVDQEIEEDKFDADDTGDYDDYVEGDEDFEGFDEDQDVHSTTDDAYIDALKNFSGTDDVAKFLMGDAWIDDDDDDDEFNTPLDDIETVVLYRDTLKAAFEREPTLYRQVQQALTKETLSVCQQLFAVADSLPTKE
mmetsp:Transcript_6423/g.12103  ORF Transcript_6423/g.12103 Transcript_6423/m.12103 type:complete len:1045 (-) Transcript_6423:2118-5252(-)|eukprot:CAMPEP_0176493212 /NCGR_PEP_ID=MMETSP0200_2-20121128/9431_1 /TAXON_ID=947934 /ORGANISM="Chaetoceros sp., Strain GSL56" /LENGTH=1044 /DNA_ID=CAMNT_0017890865 /DNA_START=80 /DNA_END=3214 /DNA_ORIENTATION=-